MSVILIDGLVGKIEISINYPDELYFKRENSPKGIALIAHPHPILGGNMNNKVTKIISSALLYLGYITYRVNFRGVGRTDGEYNYGNGEKDDLLIVLNYMFSSTIKYKNLACIFAGFSFGTFVLSHLFNDFSKKGGIVNKLIFVSPAINQFNFALIPQNTLIIHGEYDKTVPVKDIYRWADSQELPVIVIPKAEHLFHGKLSILKRTIINFI